ncbi:unnamed protein product, partial [Gulo gulo]
MASVPQELQAEEALGRWWDLVCRGRIVRHAWENGGKFGFWQRSSESFQVLSRSQELQQPGALCPFTPMRPVSAWMYHRAEWQ